MLYAHTASLVLRMATEIQQFAFDWYPVFGVVFMALLLFVFFRLMRTTMGTTKPETVKASKTEPVLWDEVQANPKYRDKTTMLVLPELGRDGDINTANGFLNHRSGDPSCRNVWLLAMGAGVSAGASDRPVYHVDVAATAAGILGIKATGMAGKPIAGLV